VRRRRLAQVVAVVLVVAATAATVSSLRQRADAEGARDGDRAAAQADRWEADRAEGRLARIESFTTANRALAARHGAGAERIETAIADLADLQGRLERSQAALIELTTLSGEQLRQIGILRACVQTLDSARAALVAGDPAASTVALEQGRQGCRQAEELADGIVDAVHPFDFPDPSVVEVDGTYYAFATNGPAGTVQVLTSTDLADWSIRGSALMAVASWARPGYTWAPSVARAASGYALYYAVRDVASNLQCVSVATSATPQGPYVDRSTAPLLCQPDLGGAIDASTYRDEKGNLFLTWKSEGETIGGTAQIWAQPLDPTGTRREWLPALLVGTDREWEGRTVEAPSMVRVGATWLLLYSGNAWSTDRYAVGYATCLGPLGPCAKPEGDNVLLRSTERVAGPGGAEVFRATGGAVKVAYAGWDGGAVGPSNPRRLHVATLELTPEGPTLS